MKKTFVIIDGHAIIHRAYHALPPMNVGDGTSVHAVYGFATMLLKIITDLKPDYLAVSFDVAGGTFRDEIFEDYKGTREKADDDLYEQIPLVYELVEAFGLPIYEKKGFEADDVIGTIAELSKTKKNGVTTIIVTGDKDMLQLVDDDITEVYLLRKGLSDFELYNEAKVHEKFTFGPERIVDYKAFRGDSSDNIPGVKGIGDKTATALITAVGGIEEIYTALKNNDSAIMDSFSASMIKKIIEGEDSARMSFELATIRRDVEGLKFKIEDAVTHEFDRDKLVALFRKFEFYSLIKRIPGYEGAPPKAGAPGAQKVRKIAKKVTIVEPKDVEETCTVLKQERRFACKAILSEDEVLNADLLGFVFVSDNVNAYIDFKKLDKKQKENVFALFYDEKITVVGHDIKQLVKVLFCHAELVSASVDSTSSQQTLKQVQGDSSFGSRLFDIMIASYLLNSSTRAHDLQQIVLRELGEEITTSDSQATLFGVDPQAIADELRAVWQVAKIYDKKFGKAEREVFETIEMPLIPVLSEMELNGIAIDEKMFESLSKDAHKTIAGLEKKIWKEAGSEFNISSSVQLREVLFDTLELPTDFIKKGKTGYSTAASELDKLREYHEIIPMIEEYREVEKLRNTYIDVLPTLRNKKTGRIHTSFNQAVASTGRLSSADPNLQNIPIRTELGKKVRDAFIAEDGYTLVAADYSQIELRIVAHLAGDKKMIEIFKSGQDIHSATASTINGVELKDVTTKQRRAAKAINFGILYGMGAFGMSARTGIPQHEAKEFIDKYFKAFKDVKAYMDNVLEQAKKEGYVETLFGRRRYIPELTSGNYQVRASGERMAINMPVQGTAADMMKLAMIRVHEKISAETHCNASVRMLLQVHDEIVLEVKEGLEEEVVRMVEKEMVDILKLDVPVVVEAKAGKRWGELK